MVTSRCVDGLYDSSLGTTVWDNKAGSSFTVVVSGFANLTIAGNLVWTGAGASPLVWHLNNTATNQPNSSDVLTILGVAALLIGCRRKRPAGA